MVPLRSKPCRGVLAEHAGERVGVAERAGSQEPAAFAVDVSSVAIPLQASVGSKTRSAGRNRFILADGR